MIATITSKGQVTLPKAVRDALKLDAGSKLDFTLHADGTLTARALNRSVDSLFGMLHRPGRKASTIAEMKAARDQALADDDRRIVKQARERHPHVSRKAA